MSDLTIFVGRFHPLVVHVPIGVLLLLAVSEAMGWRWSKLRLTAGARMVVLGFVVLGAALAAGCGWLLAQQGSYDEALVGRHQNLGFITLGLTVALFAVQKWLKLYGSLLAAAVAIMAWTGHNGGSLTHGPGYLAEHAPAMLRPLLGGGAPGRPAPATLAEADVFYDVVQPVLNARCVACHGESRADGDLRLDSFEAILAGGEHGEAIVAGSPAESLLLQRLYLPLDHKEHMPPAGRPQPTDFDLAVLDWWIADGSPAQGGFMARAPDPVVVEIVAAQLGLPPPPIPDRAEMLAIARELEVELGITIRPLTTEEPWLGVNARLAREDFDDDTLTRLLVLAPALHRLDLGGTGVTDAGMVHVAQMTELRRLRLDGTAITDTGLVALAPLKRLASLNLHSTGVTDAATDALTELPRLRQLYVWQTGMTPMAALSLAEALENRRKLDRYRAQIAANQRRIADETFRVDFGAEPLVLLEEAEASPAEDE
ncbi:MAG: hypothetical protein HOH58_07415 [Opitutaceae bacterium]|jgi:uncharacterized membrane protein|nr:hypothetical protein [Opitutaceae bacterium]